MHGPLNVKFMHVFCANCNYERPPHLNKMKPV